MCCSVTSYVFVSKLLLAESRYLLSVTLEPHVYAQFENVSNNFYEGGGAQSGDADYLTALHMMPLPAEARVHADKEELKRPAS